ALVTLNRPQALNALNKNLLDDISNFLTDANADSEIRVIILTGSGDKSFVAGADIKEFSDFNGAQGQELAANGQENVFDKIENFP
ncbi:MAG: enoyl-CoA hydratase/isomerase family protein, partial [Algoriella sp.]